MKCKNCGHDRIAHSPRGKKCAYYIEEKKTDCECKEFIKPSYKTEDLHGKK